MLYWDLETILVPSWWQMKWKYCVWLAYPHTLSHLMRCRGDLCPVTPWQKKSVNPTGPTLTMCVVHSVRRYVMHKQFTNQTARKTGLSPFCSLPDLPVHLCLCEHHLCWLFDGDQMSIPLSFLSLPLCSSPQLSIPPSPAPSLHSGQLADFICDTCFARRSLSPQNIWIVSKASYFWECVGCRGLLLSLGLTPPPHTHPFPNFFSSPHAAP